MGNAQITLTYDQHFLSASVHVVAGRLSEHGGGTTKLVKGEFHNQGVLMSNPT